MHTHYLKQANAQSGASEDRFQIWVQNRRWWSLATTRRARGALSLEEHRETWRTSCQYLFILLVLFELVDLCCMTNWEWWTVWILYSRYEFSSSLLGVVTFRTICAWLLLTRVGILSMYEFGVLDDYYHYQFYILSHKLTNWDALFSKVHVWRSGRGRTLRKKMSRCMHYMVELSITLNKNTLIIKFILLHFST